MPPHPASRTARLRARLDRLFYSPHDRWGRRVRAGLSLLILASVGLLGVEFAASTGTELPPVLYTVDHVILAVFSVEYLLRLWVVTPQLPEALALSRRDRLFYATAARVSWALKPLNLVDLIALLPLFPFLRSLRALRVLRLVTRVDFTRRLFRYFDPFAATSQLLRTNRLVFLFVWGFVVIATFLGAATVYIAEHRTNPGFSTPLDALWWAVVTITTVGYGDKVPMTAGGRVVAMALMFSGFFILAMVAGVVSQTLVHTLMHIREEGLRMTALVNQCVVCGWNRNTSMLLRLLREQSPELAERVVVFAEREPPADFPEWVTFVKGDPTQEIELSKVRLEVASQVLVSAEERPGLSVSDTDARTLLTVFTVRSFERKLLGQGLQRTRPIHVAAEILDPDNVPFFRNAGADEALQTALMSASLLAKAAAVPRAGQLFADLACTAESMISPIDVPPKASLPTPFEDLASALKRESGTMVVGLLRGDLALYNPAPGTRVERGDRLLTLAPCQVRAGVERPLSFWANASPTHRA